MPQDLVLLDEDGDEVDVSLLEHGDVVWTEDGEELVYVEEGADEGELAEVGKAALNYGGALKSLPGDIASHVGRNKGKYATGAGVGTGIGATGYALGRKKGKEKGLEAAGVGKAEYYDAISKAVTEEERLEIVAKALDEVDIAKAAAAQAWHAVEEERDARLEMEFISKADEYNLPIDAEVFGPILKRMVEALPAEDLEVLDAIFKSVGDALYDEIGYVGGGDNVSVLDTVNAYADDLVAKNDGYLHPSLAMTALLEANPDVYDAYISEQNGR